MNGRERILATIKGEPVDRYPVAQHNFMFVVNHTGLTMREFISNPEKAARAFADTAYDFGYDCVIIDFDTCVLAEAMGATIEFPEDEPARIAKPAVEAINEVRSLPIPDLEKDGRLPLWIETTKELRKMVGDELAIMARADQGPFGLLFLLRDSMSLMMDLLEVEREVIFDALNHCVEVGVKFAKAQLAAGADMTSIGDGAGGQSLVSPETYMDLVQPFEKKYNDALNGKILSLHICGKAADIIEGMVDTGCAVLELDHYNNLDKVFKTVRNRACVFGNLDPASVICNGSAELVREKSLEAMRAAARHDARFVLCPGCMVNSNTPPENVRAMTKAAKEFELNDDSSS